jgi:hypothetical protein
MILPNDRLAFAAAALTCNAVGRGPRLLRIANTLRLGEFTVTPELLGEVRANPSLEILDDLEPLPFGDDGNLRDLGSPGVIVERNRAGALIPSVG